MASRWCLDLPALAALIEDRPELDGIGLSPLLEGVGS